MGALKVINPIRKVVIRSSASVPSMDVPGEYRKMNRDHIRTFKKFDQSVVSRLKKAVKGTGLVVNAHDTVSNPNMIRIILGGDLRRKIPQSLRDLGLNRSYVTKFRENIWTLYARSVAHINKSRTHSVEGIFKEWSDLALEALEERQSFEDRILTGLNLAARKMGLETNALGVEYVSTINFKWPHYLSVRIGIVEEDVSKIQVFEDIVEEKLELSKDEVTAKDSRVHYYEWRIT